MAEDLISSIIDNPAIEAEIAKVEARLTELSATIKTFPKASLFFDASGAKDLSAANKELSNVSAQLKIKNQELTNSIKEQQLALKQAAEERRIAAAAQKEADKQAAIAAKQRIADEKESARQAQIAGQAKIAALQAQEKAELELAAAQKQRASTDIGTFDIQQGSGQSGNTGIKKTVAKEAAFVPANDTEANLLFLTKTEAALKANQAAQKDLGAQLKTNSITQEQYNAKIVEARAAELEYKKQIQLTNAELKARTNADFAIQGSIDAARAQNTLLTQQRNSVPVGEGASPEDVARLKELNAEIDKNNELIDKNNDLLGRQKINIGNYPNAFGGAFKTLNTELEQVQGKLVSGNFKGKEFDELTAKLTVLQNATKLTGKEFTTTASQQNAFKEAALQIGQVYGQNSEVFKNFSSQVKDGNGKIAGLTQEFTKSATAGKGLSGVFTKMYSGLRTLANIIPGLGIGGVVLLLLGPLQAAGASIVRVVKKSMESVTELTDEAKKHIEDLAKASGLINAEYVRSSTASIVKLENLRSVITDTTKTEKERLAALHDYNKIADSNNKIDDKQINNLNLINDSIARQITLIEKRALASAGEKIVTDAAVKLLLAQQKAAEKATKEQIVEDAYNIETVEGAKTDAYFKTLTREGAIRAKIAKDADVKQAQAEFDAAKQIARNNQDINGYTGEAEKEKTKAARKSHDDSERLADEFRKKDLEALAKFTKDELTILKNRYKEEADDQNRSLEQRLASVQDYYKVSAQLIANDVKVQEDALNLEVEVANKRASKIGDPKKRADAQNAIEKYRIDKLKTIQQEGLVNTTALEKELYKENSDIAVQSYAKIQKAAEEAYKVIADQAKIAFQNQKDTIDINKDDQLLQLEKDFAAGRIKNVEDYNNKKQSIEQAADIAQKQLDLKRIKEQEVVFEALYGVQNISLIKAAKDLEVEINAAGNKAILDSDKQLQDKKKEFGNKLIQTLQEIAGNAFDSQSNKNDADLKAIEAKSQKEIDAINASTLAHEDKQKRIIAIQKQADFQSQQIEKRQQQQDIARAKFEKAASVISISVTTAEAVAKITAAAAVARATYAAIPGVGLAVGAAVASSLLSQIPFVIGTGILEIAAVLSKPIPHFKEGTKSAPKGMALVSEEGPELMVNKQGQMFLTPARPSLIDLAGGEQIFSHDRTKDFLEHHNLLTILQKAQSSKQPAKVDNGFNEKIYRELRTLNGKPPFVISVQNGMETSDYYMRNIKN